MTFRGDPLDPKPDRTMLIVRKKLVVLMRLVSDLLRVVNLHPDLVELTNDLIKLQAQLELDADNLAGLTHPRRSKHPLLLAEVDPDDVMQDLPGPETPL